MGEVIEGMRRKKVRGKVLEERKWRRMEDKVKLEGSDGIQEMEMTVAKWESDRDKDKEEGWKTRDIETKRPRMRKRREGVRSKRERGNRTKGGR